MVDCILIAINAQKNVDTMNTVPLLMVEKSVFVLEYVNIVIWIVVSKENVFGHQMRKKSAFVGIIGGTTQTVQAPVLNFIVDKDTVL